MVTFCPKIQSLYFVIEPQAGFFNFVRAGGLVRHCEWLHMRSTFLILSAALLAAQSPVQQKPKAEIQEVRATGCVRQAADTHCLLLETLDGQTTYTFLAAPKPELGTVITIQGKQHEGRSACKEGIPIDITDWEPTGEMCVQTK